MTSCAQLSCDVLSRYLPFTIRCEGQSSALFLRFVGIVGLAAASLSIFADTSVRHFSSSDGLPEERIRSITQTFDGLLWLASPSGLSRFDGQSWKHFDRRSHPTLADERLTCLTADRLGYLWIGTQEGGLHRFDGVRFRPVSKPNQVGGPWAVSALHQEADATLWIGTPEDLLYLEPNASASLYGLPGVRISDLMQDHYDYMWASAGRGLFRQVQKTFQSITLPLGLETSVINALVMTADGQLAVGREDGLLYLRGDFEGTGLPQSYTFDPRFEDRPVRALLVDRKDRLIVALNDTLVRIETDGSSTRLLTSAGSDADAAAQTDLQLTVVFEDREGHLWVGSRASGLWQIVNPEPSAELTAHVTGLTLDDRGFPPRRQLIMPPDSQELSLAISAPTFIPNATPHLRYRLEGHEETWQDPAEAEWIRYPKLPPGTYRFAVETSLDGASWSGGSEMTITRQPRFHQTRSFWFKTVGSLLIVTGLIVGWFWYQRRQAIELARMRAREWRELQEESGLIDPEAPPLDPDESSPR